MALGRCDWRQSTPEEYAEGVRACTCDEPATLRLRRKDRDTDLFLCLPHARDWQAIYGPLRLVEVL